MESAIRFVALNRRGKRPGKLWGRVVLAALNTALAGLATADEPRTRTLRFDDVQGAWVEVTPPTPGTAEGDLYEIRSATDDGRYRQALEGCKRFEKQYTTEHGLYPEVLVAQAEALIAQEKYDKALKILRKFFEEFPGTPIASEADRLKFVLAEAYLGGAKRRFAGIPLLSGVDTAYELLDQISAESTDGRLAELAIKTKADHLYANGEHSVAQLEYSRLSQDFPSSRYHRFAMQRSAQAALASFAGVDFDAAPLLEAEERFRDYQARYPADAQAERVSATLDTIHERQADKELRTAQYYERTGHIASAIFYYQLVVENWRESAAAGTARRRLQLLGADGDDAGRGG